MKKITIIKALIVLMFVGCTNTKQKKMNTEKEYQTETFIEFQQNEKWWAGIVFDGEKMPFVNQYSFDMRWQGTPNQMQPLFISNKGRYVFSDEPVRFSATDKKIKIESNKQLKITEAGKTLKEAYLKAASKHFVFSGNYPDTTLFKYPQYNTWIELTYNQNQKDILKYAQTMLDNGMPPGVLMIDDTWQHDYGVWEFDRNKFENPKEMMDKLHAKGFKLMLWICPFISPDSREYRQLAKEGGLLLDAEGKKPKMVEWWNGVSAVLDFSHPNGTKWFKEQLDRLQNDYGVDGFKFDAGDIYFYYNSKAYKDITPNEHCRLFNEIGLDYPLNEYRAGWKMGGQPLAQRLQDKAHNWDDLQLLFPHVLLQGIMGYPFTCPDMIGGGNFTSFIDGATIDQELIVRSTQCHVFMPMMQFSVNPFRILDKEHATAVKEAVALRQKFVPLIMELVKNAAKTGEPVVRFMEYEFPNQGFDKVKNQFMLGSNYLIAPVLKKGTKTQKVILPKGKWKDAAGKIYHGDTEIEIPVSLTSIPYFEKI